VLAVELRVGGPAWNWPTRGHSADCGCDTDVVRRFSGEFIGLARVLARYEAVGSKRLMSVS